MRIYVVILGVLLFGLNCGGGGVNVDAEKRKLLDTDNAWASAAKVGDVNRVMAFWSDDAINFFPGMSPAKGKEAIHQLVERNRSRAGFSLTWEPTEAKVAASGDLGYTYGTFTLTVSGSDGQPVSRGGSYMCVWEKTADGRWQCALESTVFGPG